MGESPNALPRDPNFPATSWGLVARAGQADSVARAALAELYRKYWYPLYVFARRGGAGVSEAEDLTQGFFTHLLSHPVTASADRTRGRFRTYLLQCFKNYRAKISEAENALKRGGAARIVALDFAGVDSRYEHEPADPADPERLYLRRWALTLIDEAFAELEAEYAAADRWILFDRLKGGLLGDRDATYALIGNDIGMTADAVKQAASRLRTRFGQKLRSLVGALVADDSEIDDEIRDLLAALAG